MSSLILIYGIFLFSSFFLGGGGVDYSDFVVISVDFKLIILKIIAMGIRCSHF